MKSVFLSSSIIVSVFSTFSYASPIEVAAPIDSLFLPSGFDSNDNVEVVVAGTFPNSCYRTGRTNVTLDQETREIKIDITAYRYLASSCGEVLTPFLHTIKLGILDVGSYAVHLTRQPNIKGTLNIQIHSSESADEHMYAPVDLANITIDRETGDQMLTLKGELPLTFVGCAVIDQIDQYREPENVLVVLPKIRLTDGEECIGNKHHYSVTTRVENPLIEKGLIHIRSVNGTSFNGIYDPMSRASR